MTTSIGMRLRAERERLGMSQLAVAKAIRAGTQREVVIWRWESGRIKPNADALAAMCLIGFDVPYILTGKRGVDKPRKSA